MTRALLRDEAAQQSIDDRGWAVLDLFGRRAVRSLRRSHRRLPHIVTTDRSFARGFHATIIDDRLDYRRNVHAAIAADVAPAIERHFIDVELALTNFVQKEPGADRVPNHIDWTFVDESVHRSLSVWTPLCNTDSTTGCIGVIDGSHRRVSFIRAATTPSYLDTDAFGAGLDGHRLVPLRAGQAVVFDHRLVHFSEPHRGRRPRIAVTFELVPVEAPLLHFEQIGPGRFVRHSVRPEFFVGYVAGGDPRRVPGHVAAEAVDAPSFDQLQPT